MVITGRAGLSELLAFLFSSFSAKQIERMLFIQTEMCSSPSPVKTNLGGKFPGVRYADRFLCEWVADPRKQSCSCDIEISVFPIRGVKIIVTNLNDSYLPNMDLRWVTTNMVNLL